MLIRNYNHAYTVFEYSHRSPYITSLLRIYNRAYPDVYSRLLLVYLPLLLVVFFGQSLIGERSRRYHERKQIVRVTA